jgi:Fe-S-cluster containining protein
MDKNFFEFSQDNPCQECSAPCCKMLLIDYPAPATFMEMDYIRYMLGFPSIKIVLKKDGIWQVKVEQTCSFLDLETNLCTVHNTPKQPKTCAYYNPYHCWYKRNYTQESSPDLVEIDLAKFELLLENIQFDGEGNIAKIPSWEFVRNLLNAIKTE